MATNAGGNALEWDKDKLVCKAVYTVLEGEEFLDEFEDTDRPIEDAAGLKMEQLRYFLHGASATVMDGFAQLEAMEFTGYLGDIYGAEFKVAKPLNKQIAPFKAIFKDKKKTLLDLARLVDASMKFPS